MDAARQYNEKSPVNCLDYLRYYTDQLVEL